MKYHSALRVNACLLAMLVISGSVSAATQINALFMTQAAYSENDIRAMTSDFEKQHPDVKVNLEFVPYEALHDKIVAANKNEKSKTFLIEGMDHTFNVFSEEDLHSIKSAIDATGTFFAETLG